MIKTIIFDLSEVYIHGLAGIEKDLKKEYLIKYHPSRKEELFNALLKGKITEDSFWTDMKRKNEWDNITETELKELTRKCFKVYDSGIPAIVNELKKKYRVILLSDHVREWVEYINDTYGLKELFDECIYSYEVDDLKSEKGRMFSKALEMEGVKGSECLFIDDSEKNLKKAKLYGINTILFNNSEQLKKDLKEYGLMT